ncbi:MAG: hypothetical protein JW969_05700 [Spirochaetales bacterium]|nr:hypothetical protein [Spirochaetales bacterium]
MTSITGKCVLLLIIIIMTACVNTKIYLDDEGYGITDDFESYPAGSDASPRWDTDSMGWEIKDNALTFPGNVRGTAFYATDFWSQSLRTACVLKVERAVAKEWKVAGIIIGKDDGNFWHLALVESPDSDGKKHYVELAEMHNGVWNAQHEEKTRLKGSSSNTAFNWEYDKPYVLKVILTPEAVSGTIEDPDGKEITRMSYVFDNDLSVRLGRAGFVASGLKSSFSMFRADLQNRVAIQSKVRTFPPYIPPTDTPAFGKKTGFFHTEKAGGTWWLVDPAGRKFFIVGTDHVNYYVHWCEKLGYAPYHRNVEKKYGDEKTWAESAVKRLKEWGFNSLGVGSSESVRQRGLPWMENLTLGMLFTGFDYITPRTTWTGFPDVFSPKFAAFCDKMAAKICGPLKDDPWLIGYFIDNELEWHPWTAGGPFADTFKLERDRPAKQALVNYLKERFGVIGEYNRAFDPDSGGFDALLEQRKAPKPVTDEGFKSIEGYIRLIAGRYFKVTTEAIRKHDPNHLILGCRFAGQAPDIWDIAGKYSDIVSVNCYRTLDLETGAFTDGFEEEINAWQKKALKPFLISEWSFPALDAGLPCRYGAGQRVPTQKEKSFAFAAFQRFLFSRPFIVGSNYFMWADEPALGISSTFPEDSNYGLVNVDDVPYGLLTKTAATLNPLVYRIHNSDVSRISIKPGKTGLEFNVVNEGKIKAEYNVTAHANGLLLEEKKVIAPGGKLIYDFSSRFKSRPLLTAVTVRAKPVSRYLDDNPAGVSLTRILYLPGVKTDAANGVTIPFLATNPSGTKLKNTPIVLRMDKINLKGKSLENAVSLLDGIDQKECPFQIDSFEEGAELSFLCHEIKPSGFRSFYLRLGQTKNSTSASLKEDRQIPFQLTNGKMTFDCAREKGDAIFNSIQIDNMKLGSFAPLIWMFRGKDEWTPTGSIEEVVQYTGPVRTVLDVTAAGSYRIKYRFTIYPGKSWFKSRVLWIENTSGSAFTLKAYYHYIRSFIGGDASNDIPEMNVWRDGDNNYFYGAVPGTAGITTLLWKDASGHEHPDVHKKLEIVLKPGGKFIDEPSPVYIIAGPGDSLEAVESEIKGIINQQADFFDKP